MKMARLIGPATTFECLTCGKSGIGGSEPFTSASTGKTLTPDEWYATDDEKSLGPYCAPCATKIVEAEDPTRSVTQFYSNVTGEKIEPEHL